MHKSSHRNTHCSTSVRALAIVAALFVGPGQLEAQACDDIGFRIWQPGGAETRYAFGDTIRLENGVEAHLYIHHRSQSRNPYSTSAEIGRPSQVGLRAPYNQGVVALRAQKDGDRRAGRLIMTAQGRGRTALGYRVFAVSAAGLFERLARGCRRGVVMVEVIGGPSEGDASVEAQRAARKLAHTVEKSLMPWRRAAVEDDELERVLQTGRAGLIEHAGQILRSEPFREESYFETLEGDDRLRAEADRIGDVEPRQVAEVLLAGVYRLLYGGNRPFDRLHRANLEDLLDCVSASPRDRGRSCDQLAERLIASPAFQQAFRGELNALGR